MKIALWSLPHDGYFHVDELEAKVNESHEMQAPGTHLADSVSGNLIVYLSGAGRVRHKELPHLDEPRMELPNERGVMSGIFRSENKTIGILDNLSSHVCTGADDSDRLNVYLMLL
jgi:hypothetical protein